MPDVVEQEVGNFFRTFYKLEKVFADIETAREMSKEVNADCT